MDMLILIFGLLLFLGIHSIRMVAPQYREAGIAAMGGGAWRALYTTVSVIGLVLIIWGYARAQPAAPVLYVPPLWLTHVTVLLMAFSFVALAVYAVPAGRLKPMLRHPMLVAIKIWALAHLLANGDMASLLLFLAFLGWAVADRISVKRRGVPVSQPGPVSNDVIAVAAGLVLWALFIWKLHEWLIGVPLPIA